MIVYATSDIHGNLPAIPEDADVLLLAGDICPDFRPPAGNHWDMVDKGGHQQARWLDTEFRGWLDSAVDRGITVLATWGNHDFVGEHPGLIPNLPWVLLVDETAHVGGLSIHGTPWVPGLPYWAFYGDERRLKLRADAIPECDILMSHGPPLGVGDYIPTSEKQRTKYGNFGGEHVGDQTLTEAIDRVRPRVTVCGHIHEARGAYVMAVSVEPAQFIDATKPIDMIEPSYSEVYLHNVAAVDEAYSPHLRPFTRLYEVK